MLRLTGLFLEKFVKKLIRNSDNGSDIEDKLLAMPPAWVARKLAPLTYSIGLQLVGGAAPKPPFNSINDSLMYLSV